jgi:hypothetical protein
MYTNNNPADDSQLDGQPEPDADDLSGGMSSNEICVDLQSLAMPEEGEGQMNTPSPGDKVQMAVEGEVTRIEGTKAYVKMEAVNGQEVKDDASEQQPNDEQELASLQGMAQGMPDRY